MFLSFDFTEFVYFYNDFRYIYTYIYPEYRNMSDNLLPDTQTFISLLLI